MPAKLEENRFEYKGYKYITRKLGYRLEQIERDRDKLRFLGLNEHWWCGYVEIPKDHKVDGVEYDDINIDCHGGLTYSRHEGDKWVIGFDCNHFDDNPIEQDEDYVKMECQKIIDQLIQMEQANESNI